MKQHVDIEKLLQWAYRDELPKQAIGGLTGWEQSILLLGTRIDNQTQPDAHFPVAMGAPHPDALKIDWVVRQLERIGGEIAERQPKTGVRSGRPGPQRQRYGADLANLAEFLGDDIPACASVIRTYEPARLVTFHAQMGTRPTWDVGQINVHPRFGNRKQPEISWLDEYGRRTKGSKRGGYYSTGACCELRYDPEPKDILDARAEYLVWYVSLVRLVAMLSMAGLTEHVAILPRCSSSPWAAKTTHKPMIFRDNSQLKAA